jgi:sialic acid synthase SpsE/spore coat polysaccharide biosynthesis protein SpsF (cytidylyltransferase family)
MSKVCFVAEAGASHGGHFGRACQLIHEAQRAGADAVKFQIWKTNRFVAKTSSFYEAFSKIELEPDQWVSLKKFADSEGIAFWASVFDVDSADLALRMKLSPIKVASGDITYLPLLKHLAKKKVPVVLSTGMATYDEIKKAVELFNGAGVTLLKCTVDYPTNEHDVNLAGVRSLQLMFPTCDVGFSDHTKGFLAPCLAVSMGVTIIEKHFDICETGECTGVPGLVETIKRVREAESILGSHDLRTFPAENKWKTIARRGPRGLREEWGEMQREFCDHSNHIGIIIQARIKSSRLPGKVFLPINGKTMIQWTVDSCKETKLPVLLAVPDGEGKEFAEKTNCDVYEGDHLDVLKRVYGASKFMSYDPIVRITGDCPLVDTNMVLAMVKDFANSRFGYMSNAHPVRTVPQGLDVEIFTFSMLETAHRCATESYQREHVTPYMYQRMRRWCGVWSPAFPLSWKLCVDTKEDYDRVKEMIEKGTLPWLN